MANQWTREQRQVIDARNCSLLVSAAAGSGKTAVLVERILSLVMDEQRPVDIDQLLVVTFTNAAAAEMRERVQAALEQQLDEHPENLHLQRQIALIHHAQITTIHSFCLDVIRNHFDVIGLDPGFRIGDEGELKLLQQEVLEQLLEMEYKEKKEDYLIFVEAFAPGKTDQELEELILQLYAFSMGYPWPKKWLENCLTAYEVESLEDLEKTDWMQELLQMLQIQCEDLNWALQSALELANHADGPSSYVPTLEDDLERLKELENCRDYSSYYERFSGLEQWPALSRKKNPDASPEKTAWVKELRDQVKTSCKKIREDFFYEEPEQMTADMKAARTQVAGLIRITQEFQEAYAAKKAEKNLVDFNDLEHFALQILVKEEQGAICPTETAAEYVQHFAEIMIDEYQDSNLVQEILLNSVAKQSEKQNNVFMVGDVKQSIYRFRLARPEMFLDKYQTYQAYVQETPDQKIIASKSPDSEISGEEKEAGTARSNGCRIDLHKNFRSRKEVLQGVNLIFCQIMTPALGGILYGRDAALYYGANFPLHMETPATDDLKTDETVNQEAAKDGLTEDNNPYIPELLLIDGSDVQKEEEATSEAAEGGVAGSGATDGKAAGSGATGSRAAEDRAAGSGAAEGEVAEEEAAGNLRSLEAEAVAGRIQELIGKELVWDSKKESYRSVRYSDIVILLRAVSGWSETVQEILSEHGIPSYTGSGTGYFSTLEIRTVLSYLRVLDNPRQDIALAAVLRSPIGGLQEEDLARLRINSPDSDFYTCCMRYLERNKKDTLFKKLNAFWEQLQQLRTMVPYTPMHILLWKILEDTGYGNYAAALPGGAQRKANLDMLVEKAVAYEATSYRGLFNFIRYIENLQKYEVDYGEASVISETEDTVRIMSIHKSKGLEFPIVFVCGMGKNFNQQDSRSRLIQHPSLGVGCDYVDLEHRVQIPVLMKKVIRQKIKEENLGEELRILYVAMTRAKEKLILCGSVSNMEKGIKKWQRELQQKQTALSYTSLVGASSYLDWIMPALLRHSSGEELRENWNLLYEKEEMAGTAEWQGKTNRQAGTNQQSEVSQQTEASQQSGTSQQAEANRKGGAASLLEGKFLIRVLNRKQLGGIRQEEKAQMDWKQAELLMMREDAVYDLEARDYLEQTFATCYPYEADQQIQGKLSVSELKKQSHTEEIVTAEELFKEPQIIPLLPRFMKEEEAVSGAARGTVYHHFLENVDFQQEFDEKFLKTQLETMISCGKILKEEAKWISGGKMKRFLSSQLAGRMQQAARRGELFREQPFVLGVQADEVRKDWNPSEMVLIQGIIDAYFYEDGQIVLLDYKTDRIEADQQDLLAKRYRIQLDYYQEALERLTGKQVKEKVIYSFCLDTAIQI